MRMQEVIAQLREEAPLLEANSHAVDASFQRVWGLFGDFTQAASPSGRAALAGAIGGEMTEFAKLFRTLRASIETVCIVNAEYKEKLGPRARKPKDAPGQMELPGMETCTSGVATAADHPSRTASGRHG